MRIRTLPAALTAALLSMHAGAAEFVYRGQLSDGDRPAQGQYDLQVTVYASEFGGAPLAPAIVLPGLNVQEGRFATRIQFDDALMADGTRWLELAVRENGAPGAFDTLPVREKAVLAPDSFCVGTWSTTGNAGNPAGSYLGTSDVQPVELRANNVAFLKASAAGQINLGDPTNQPTGQAAVTIGGGGGQSNAANQFAALAAGGSGNTAAGYASATVGGAFNQAQGRWSATFGGLANRAGADSSVAMGSNAAARNRTDTGEPVTCDNDFTCGDEGAFVWGDRSTGANFTSTGPNQFLVRAAGGVGINTNAPAAGQLAVAGDIQLTRTAARKLYVGIEPDNNTPGKTLTISAGDASNSGVPFQARLGGDLVLQAGNAYNADIASQDGGDVLIRSGSNWLANGNVALSGGDIVLQTGGVSNSFTERMRVKDTGEVSVAVLGAAGATTLCRNASNQIATCSSSARYKEHIVDADYGLDTVAALRPVRYEWKDTHTPDLGLVAEEVAAVEPDLTTRNDAGQVEGVKYDRLAAVLVKAVQEQQAQLRDQKREIDALRAEQQDLIRRLELAVAGGASGPAPGALPAASAPPSGVATAGGQP